VFVDNYRGRCMANLGFSPQQLAEERPGIIYCSVRCYGYDGPWANRGGFDMEALCVSGFTQIEGTPDRPMFPPTKVMNDCIAGYMGAAGVSVKWAPWGTAALGAVGAMMTEGGARHAAIAFAAAGAGIGVLHALGILDKLADQIDPSLPRRQADAADASAPDEAPSSEPHPDVTKQQVDFQKAIDQVVAKNEAQLKALHQSTEEKFAELRRVYESRIEEISASYEQRIADQEQTISNLLRELGRAQAPSVGPRLVRDEAPPAVEEAPAPESQPAEAPVATESVGPTPETVSKAQAIVDQLTHEEDAELRQLVAAASPNAIAFVNQQIANMTAEEAVAWLRANVLTARTAA
jgi:hypothetical protein